MTHTPRIVALDRRSDRIDLVRCRWLLSEMREAAIPFGDHDRHGGRFARTPMSMLGEGPVLDFDVVGRNLRLKLSYAPHDNVNIMLLAEVGGHQEPTWRITTAFAVRRSIARIEAALAAVVTHGEELGIAAWERLRRETRATSPFGGAVIGTSGWWPDDVLVVDEPQRDVHRIALARMGALVPMARPDEDRRQAA